VSEWFTPELIIQVIALGVTVGGVLARVSAAMSVIRAQSASMQKSIDAQTVATKDLTAAIGKLYGELRMLDVRIARLESVTKV
jgi:hypothetical protein